MEKTVAKNRASYIRCLFAKAQDVKRYDLESYFHGESVHRGPWMRELLDKFNFAKLQCDDASGDCTLSVHSNLWYAFRTYPDLCKQVAKRLDRP